jgi:hypothetical protein
MAVERGYFTRNTVTLVTIAAWFSGKLFLPEESFNPLAASISVHA